jgi:hypothetical protein
VGLVEGPVGFLRLPRTAEVGRDLLVPSVELEDFMLEVSVVGLILVEFVDDDCELVLLADAARLVFGAVVEAAFSLCLDTRVAVVAGATLELSSFICSTCSC